VKWSLGEAGGWIQKWTDHTNLLKHVIDAGDSRHRQGPPSPQKGQQATLQNPTLNGIGMELAVIKVARRHHQARPTT